MRKRNCLLLLLCLFSLVEAGAQTAEQAKTFYEKGQYAQARPLLKKFAGDPLIKANFDLWYGVSCLRTNAPDEALRYLQSAARRRVVDGQLYLAEAYCCLYRFDEAVKNYQVYMTEQAKKKKNDPATNMLLNQAKLGQHMLENVEKVNVIDSFVVDKADFLSSYKLSEESGKIFGNGAKGTIDASGAYETELGNKTYYAAANDKGKLNLYTKNKIAGGWTKGVALPIIINKPGSNVNYPYLLSDGLTIYYAADGDGSMGGYDLFVTRYNTDNDTYLAPENMGMPYNSPFNDYMYVEDELNNLGWFASDRYQPADKVCIYVFIPNESKVNYDETLPLKQRQGLAQLRPIKSTWTDKSAVASAKERLLAVLKHKPQPKIFKEFTFDLDDTHTYYTYDDFKSPKAKELFHRYQQQLKDYATLSGKLDKARTRYSTLSDEEKKAQTPVIIDLEKKVETLGVEVDAQAVSIRNLEIQTLKE